MEYLNELKHVSSRFLPFRVPTVRTYIYSFPFLSLLCALKCRYLYFDYFHYVWTFSLHSAIKKTRCLCVCSNLFDHINKYVSVSVYPSLCCVLCVVMIEADTFIILNVPPFFFNQQAKSLETNHTYDQAICLACVSNLHLNKTNFFSSHHFWKFTNQDFR